MSWASYMLGLSDEDVLDYIHNYRQYETEAVEAAIAELRRRGILIPQEKIDNIRIHLIELDRKAREEAEESNFVDSLMSGKLDHKATNDPTAPLLYSQKAIYFFCILVSPMFGAFMLAANIDRTPQRKGFFVAAIFGLLYPSIVGLLLHEIGTSNIMLVFLLNGIGALIINGVLWPQFIGKSTVYQKRAPIYPLIFALILILVVVMVLLNV